MKILRPLYKLWMKFALVLGWVNTRLLLIIIFYAVLTPLAFFYRLFGKSFMKLKIDTEAASYWEQRLENKDEHNYFRQF